MNDYLPGDSKLAITILKDIHPFPFTSVQEQYIEHIKIKNKGEQYKLQIWFRLNELDEVINELHHLIGFLSASKTHVDAIVLIKSYVISWCTLSDMFANLLNEVFDLGIDEKDIKLSAMLRNKHIKNSDVPKIWKKYKKKIKYGKFSDMRNDIVHRGILKDPIWENIRFSLNSARLLRALDRKKEAKLIKVNFKKYLRKKQSEFTDHLQDTKMMIEDMIDYLTVIFNSKLKIITKKIKKCKKKGYTPIVLRRQN